MDENGYFRANTDDASNDFYKWWNKYYRDSALEKAAMYFGWLAGKTDSEGITWEGDKLTNKVIRPGELNCGFDCHTHEKWGFVPESGCPVHDRPGKSCGSSTCPNNETGIGADFLCKCKPKSTDLNLGE